LSFFIKLYSRILNLFATPDPKVILIILIIILNLHDPNVIEFGCNFFFFGFEETSPPRKAHFVGPGEGVKPRLSQTLTRDARPDSNSRPAVQIPNPLPSRYAPWGRVWLQHQT